MGVVPQKERKTSTKMKQMKRNSAKGAVTKENKMTKTVQTTNSREEHMEKRVEDLMLMKMTKNTRISQKIRTKIRQHPRVQTDKINDHKNAKQLKAKQKTLQPAATEVVVDVVEDAETEATLKVEGPEECAAEHDALMMTSIFNLTNAPENR